MELVYIRFEVALDETPGTKENFIQKSLKWMFKNVLFFFVPKANPDYDSKISRVKYWLLELDKETGTPQREIGLDINEIAIVKMPFLSNYGYWTDNNLLLDDFKERFAAKEITNPDFENKWSSLE